MSGRRVAGKKRKREREKRERERERGGGPQFVSKQKYGNIDKSTDNL